MPWTSCARASLDPCYGRRVRLTPGENAAVAAMVAWLRSAFGQRVRELAVFGSRARGEGHEGSDVDVLAVIDELSTTEGREIAARCGDILTEHDIIVSVLSLSSARMDELRRRGRRLVIEIDREGVGL